VDAITVFAGGLTVGSDPTVDFDPLNLLLERRGSNPVALKISELLIDKAAESPPDPLGTPGFAAQ
jgi:hypothetical protein